MIVGLVVYVRARPAPSAAGLSRNAASAHICQAIIGYFSSSGVRVEVDCISLPGNARYTVFIESEPMKRFRLSNQIELLLIEHVSSTCKLEIDRIYWRFVSRSSAVEGTASDPAANHDTASGKETGAGVPIHFENSAALSAAVEDSIEGSDRYATLPQVEATEMSWESYEEASTSEAKKRAP